MADVTELLTSPALRTRAEELAIEAELLNEKHQWQSATSDLARLQAEEIDRLNRVIADHHAMPARRVMYGNVSTAYAQNGTPSTSVFVIDDKHAGWLIQNPGQAHSSWQKLPPLPDPQELVKRAETAATMAQIKAARS